MPVVTTSGSLASGAREVGRAVALALGVDFVDQQLLLEAAQRCGVPVSLVAEHDERHSGFRERLDSLLRAFLERSTIAGGDPLVGAAGLEVLFSRTYAEMVIERPEPELTDALYIKTVTTIIRELGIRGNIVILGRGGQMILSDLPGALHVLCIAPQRLRAERLAHHEGIGLREAVHRVTESDRTQTTFYRKFWKVDIYDPALYDLTIDTSRLSFEVATELVAQAARAKEASLG